MSVHRKACCLSSVKRVGGHVWKRDLNKILLFTEIITDKLWRLLSFSWSQICWMKKDLRDVMVTLYFQREVPLLNKNCAVSLKWSGQHPRFELSRGMYCWHSLWPVKAFLVIDCSDLFVVQWDCTSCGWIVLLNCGQLNSLDRSWIFLM